MATRWGSTQRRRWTALSVDETPGSFRRLAEDETVREEWPAATLPPSALNGKSASGRAGHEQATARRAGHVQGTAIREEQEQGIMPKEEPGKVGAIQEGQRKVTVAQTGDGQDAAIQQGQGQGAVTRQALSASLPRTKRADKKPSLFKAFTWSKGKKSRPKLVEAEGPENFASSHPGDHGADPQITHTQPDQELPCHDYSERAVDVPGDDSSSKTRSPRSSSNSSSSSSSDSESPNTGNQAARDPHSTTTTKTTERKHPAISGTSETETRDLKVSEGQQSMKVEASASQRVPNSAASPSSTPGPQPSNQNLKKQGQGNCTDSDRNDPEQTSSPRPNPDIQSGCSDISGRNDTEPVSASRDADEECSARETSSGESRFDTGRRFRLEATVLVDDERPAERRVTYLGPVLLSPVGQGQGQYVHVTLAPGSSSQASDGTSLMVRPAQPLPVGASSGPAAKAVHAGQDEGPITAVSPTSQAQGVDSKQNLPSATRQSSMDRPGSPTREQDGSSASNEPEAKREARVKTLTQDVRASLEAEPSDRFTQVPSSSAGEGDDSQAREKCREDGLDSAGASHLDSGKESMIGMREGAQIVFEPAASPIPVDQSVCGSAPFSQAMFPEPDSMVCPVDVSVASVSEFAPPPCAPPRNHRRLHSTSSSASSASTSSVSSSHNRSKQKSYDLAEAGEKLSEKSGVQYPLNQMEKEVMTPIDSLHATKELPCEGQTISEECRTGSLKENNGDHHIERQSSSARHNIELLDPHVLLASEGRKPRLGSENASPAAEDRCDLKTFTSGVYVPDNTCLPQPVTVVIQDVQNCKQAPVEPAVVNCIDQTYGNDPLVVTTTTTTIFRESESNASEQKKYTSSLDMSEGENLVGRFKEEVLMRPAEGRPQKPARTSLVKEDAVVVSEAPLDTAIDRPLLPLKGTPRQSSSSSSSDSEDGASKNKSAVDASGSRSYLEVHSTAHGFTPRLLDSVKTDSENLDSSEIERRDPRMSTKGYKEKQTDSSSANSSQFFTDTSLMTEGYKEKQTDSSSANSTQFFTDTSLMDHSDLPDSNELEIPVTSEQESNAAWCFNEPHDAVVQRDDQQQLHNSSTSSLSHGKEFSDSEKSTSSSSASEKRDARKPPVFVTPPPPPEKSVRSCGSQSDLSEKSELEQDTMRTPPKPARSMDRLSPSNSPGFDRDKKKGDPSASKSLGPSSSETDPETEPPLVPPRREKPIKNGANSTSLSGDPFGHTSFTDSAINKAAQDNSTSATSSLSEPKGDQWTPPSKQTQPFKKDPDHSQASAFIPYEDSEIYYTDTALFQKNKGEQSLTTRTVSNDSNQSKKGKSLACRRSDKSGSSSDESNKGKDDYSPPPIPPRQKMSGKKATTKSAPDVNSSTSSVTSQGSTGPRDRSFSGGLEKPCVRPGTATECASGGSNIVPKHREGAPPFGLGTVAPSTDRSSLSPSLQVDVLPETHDRRDTSFEVELSMQKEIPNTDVLNPQIFQSDVKLPLKPVRSPSPKVAVPRTPSPKLATPQTLSPEVVPRSAGSTFPAAGARGKVKVESMQHTDEDTSEPDLKSSMNRSVSMSSTTSTTSHEEDKAKKGSRSKLRKYWPFRRKKGNKKEKKRKGQDTDNERSVSSPHLASVPLHHSTPTLERYASEPNTSGKAVPNNGDMHDGNKHEDSDTSTLFESATEQTKEEKAKSESSDDKKANLSTSTSSSEHGSNRKVKEKGSNKNKSAGHHKEKTRSSGNQSSSSSRNVTPTPERKHKGGEKTDRKEGGQQNRDKSSPADKKRDQPASLSLSARGGRDAKSVKDKEDPEAQAFVDLPLTPPRVATPLREHAPPFYSVPHSPPQLDDHQPRFDGEFQRLDEDLQADADVAAAVAERRPPMVVVAVDLGTTHSGYAFSFSRDPSSVYVMSRWAGQEPGLLNHKTLSALLLTPEARFHSFGLAARNHYHNLLPIEARHWLYFERFKMTLHHSKELSRDTLVTAINGKQFPALTVFAHVLEFFATHALQQLSDQSGTEFRRQDVRWVVTVPAIWREPAKQLMRQAALAAGMFSRADPSQLLIVLEPEAASIYCRRLRMHQLVPEVGVARPLQSPRRSMELLSSSPAVSNLTVGTRYLVVDCGGGTVDITVHELTSTGQLVELHRATGGPHGSTGVDSEFEALLRSIFSSDFIDNYQTQFPVGWVNLMTDFESRKRAASPFKTTSFNVSLPFTFISEYRKHKGEVDQAVKKHGDPEVEWSLQGMLRLAPDAMRRLFAPTLVSIRQAVGDVLNHPNTRELRYLFLVGGFAESPLLQHEIRREFGQLLTVLIPQDVSLAVLRGAVLFGLDPKVVSVRCARLTYGVGILNRFDPERHPVQKRVHRDGVDWCTDVFDRFVAINQPVALGTSVTRRYTPARAGQLLIVLNVYSSLHPAPTFITDPGVRKCGTLYLDLHASTSTHTDADGPDLKGADGEEGREWEGSQGGPREILARMAFGDTEISVTALDVRSGKEVKASVDFLSG